MPPTTPPPTRTVTVSGPPNLSTAELIEMLEGGYYLCCIKVNEQEIEQDFSNLYTVTRLARGRAYDVKTFGRGTHRVYLDVPFCSCADWRYRGRERMCKHLLASIQLESEVQTLLRDVSADENF